MKRLLLLVTIIALAAITMVACSQATPTPQVVEKTVVVQQTVIVQQTVEVPVEKTVVVKETVVVKATPAAPAAPRTLVFSSRLFSPPREQEFFINEIIKPWEKENNATVNFQIVDDQTLLDRAKVQQETGHVTTDIIVAYNAMMSQWINNGWVEDLTPEVKKWTDRHFMETFNKNTTKDGKQYFLPVGADVYLTLANNKALPYLPKGADINALTWDQYADWAVAVAKGEGGGKVCITGIPMKSWIYMFGASELSYGATFPDANTPEAMEAWKIWSKIGKNQGYIPTVLNVDNCVDPMMREESWLTVFHEARAGQVFASNETQFTLGPAPSGPAGIGSIAGVSGYGIMKGAPNRDLAIKFLGYLTRPDIQVKIAKGTGGFIPPVKEAVDYLGTDPTSEVINKALMVLNKGVVSGVPAGNYQDWGAVKKCFDDAFADTILAGKDMSQQRADQVQACVEALKK